jgi:S-adenosylmethionine decarboxylase
MILTQTETCVGFEGPEKKLEIRFKPPLFLGKEEQEGSGKGLRAVSQERWQEILDTVKCTIISCTKNDHFDSFVLSESSLFVYPYKILIKTCGTTTLLHCVSSIQVLAKEHNTSIDLILFSRKNLNFPTRQLYPHNNFDDEVHFLNKLFNGEGFVLGPVNKDNWHVYIADYRSPKAIGSSSNQVFEVMMHDLDPKIMEQFYKKEGVTSRDTTEASGIAKLLPGSIIDDYQFEPCGYSMNGLLKEWYWTIHITPEPQCSYVSFETNAPLNSYTRLLRKVLATFRPGRATVVVLADEAAPCGDPAETFDPVVPGFHLLSHTIQTLPSGISLCACNLLESDTNLPTAF